MAELPYSQKTQSLINRMCAYVERKDFRLNKKKSEECLLKTYDLFGLKRPSKIIWCVDPFIEKFNLSALSVGSAWNALSALSARSAGSAWNARSAWRTALDDEFYYFVFTYEYCENPNKKYPPNGNDRKYLEYSELLLQALEYGMGYRVEWEDTLYCVPTPIVRIDKRNRFHSLTEPAIRWKKGKEFYFIHGVSFEKNEWKRAINNEIPAKEVLGESNIEKRRALLSLYKPEKLLSDLKGELIDKRQGYELYKLENVFSQTAYFLKYKDPSTERIYVSGIDPKVGSKGNALISAAWKWNVEFNEYINALHS